MKETIRIIQNENLQTSLLLAILASREKMDFVLKDLLLCCFTHSHIWKGSPSKVKSNL